MEVKELKNPYGGKKNNWVPIDKNAVCYLPEERPYTKFEAIFSYTVDVDNGNEKSIKAYARIWKWSRNKVRKFLNDIRTPEGHLEDTRRTLGGHPVAFINKNLWKQKDTEGTGKGHLKDTEGTPTNNPNPKSTHPHPKPKNIYTSKFAEIWEKYPNKIGKSKSELYFKKSVKTKEDWDNINIALKKYQLHLKSNGWKKPQNGSTWFNNWRDWIDYVEPVSQNNSKPAWAIPIDVFEDEDDDESNF